MTGQNIIYRVIIPGLIYGLAHWHIHEFRRRRAFERHAVQERWQIREVAEHAESEAAACAAVIDRIPITRV